MQTQKLVFGSKAQLMPGEEYLVKIHWNGAKELKQDESYFTECANDILSAHDFKYLQLRISNFVNVRIMGCMFPYLLLLNKVKVIAPYPSANGTAVEFNKTLKQG